MKQRVLLAVVLVAAIGATPFAPAQAAQAVTDESTAKPAVARGSFWYLRNTATSGSADIVFQYGDPGDVPFFGDWDGDGIETPGVFRDGVWYLRNSNDTGSADVT